LNGAVLRPDNDANKNLYGRPVPMKELVEEGNVAIPEAGRKFVESVAQAGS
jgi:hypothetical protein